MPLRDFTDDAGRAWTVWSVRPTAELRLRKRADGSDEPAPAPTTSAHLRDGWLVFETDGERRRLAPIPQDWEAVPDPDLQSLCLRAEPVPIRRRLIE